MFNSVARFILFNVLLGSLAGCVEVKDKSDLPEAQAQVIKPMAPVQELSRIHIEGPTYLYDGRFLSQKQLEYEIHQSRGVLSRETQDLEFHFNEMTFAEGAVLYTMGNRVRLHVDEMHIVRARIQTFPDNRTAPLGQKGLSGGHLYLHIGKGEGHLVLQMNGENGSEGFPGAEPDDTLKGKKGESGKKGLCSGPGVVPITIGKPGDKGQRGHIGGPGFAGGNSGTLELSIEQEKGFTFELLRSPGKGGDGGRGGRGGAGGEGGDPGRTIRAAKALGCIESKKAEDGPQGDPGPRGTPGPEGLSDLICLTRNQNTTCF